MKNRRRVGCLPSECSETALSVALTTLTCRRLGGIPIAQKVSEKRLRYLDSSGKEITKQQAMAMANGVAYYQEAGDPSKGFKSNIILIVLFSQ